MPLPYTPKTLEQAISLMIDLQKDIDMLKGINGGLSHSKLKDIEDHAKYAKVDGSRQFTAPLDLGGNDIKNSSHPALNLRDFSKGDIVQKDRGLALNYGTGKDKFNTDKIPEGSHNLYFTYARVGGMFDDTATIDFTFNSGTNKISAVIVSPYGSMYGDNISQTVAVAATDTYYELGGGLSAGAQNGMTFQNSKEIKVLTAGKYLVNYSLGVYTAAANQEIESEVMVNGTGQSNTSNHSESITANKPISLGGTGILTLAVNDVVSLSVSNHTAANNIKVEHANMTLLMVGL